jgi:hypothetical protein
VYDWRDKVGGRVLALGDEPVASGIALVRIAQMVREGLVAERHIDAALHRGLEHVRDPVPPGPHRAVEEAGCDERRDRTIELSEHRCGDGGLIEVAIVDREREGALGYWLTRVQ